MTQQTMTHEYFMRRAITLAQESVDRGDHPFGALLVKDGEILLEAHNAVFSEHDQTRHAELVLASEACRRFDAITRAQTIFYTSTEPCPMCVGALVWSFFPKIVYGCSQATLAQITGYGTFAVPCRSLFEQCLLPIEVVGPVLEEESAELHHSYWPNIQGPYIETRRLNKNH